MVAVDSTAVATISLSWTGAGPLVESYEVIWTLGECSGEEEGHTQISDGSTSYIITGLKENSTYFVSVTATNAAGSAVSDSVPADTKPASKFVLLNYPLSFPNSCVSCKFSAYAISSVACLNNIHSSDMKA